MYSAASETAAITFIISRWMFWEAEKERDFVALREEEKGPIEL